MNAGMLVPILAAVVGVLFAALSLLVATAPGWREYRWYALIASSTVLFAACDTLPPATQNAAAIAWGSRLSMFAAGVHLYGWLRYAAAGAQRAPTRLERAVGRASLACAVVSLVPGVVILDRFTVHRVAWLGVTYADASTSAFGAATYLFANVALVVPLAHYVRQVRRRVPGGGAHALALVCLMACGANDALVAARVYAGPYALDLGLLLVVVAIGSVMGRRFVANARDLDRLSTHLEREVEDRTRRLADAERTARRHERLASIGQLAAGVAHEINNPAAAIQANLEWLDEELCRGAPPGPAARESVKESLLSIARIAKIVRQLLDAGRAAGRTGAEEPIEVAKAVKNALALSRTTRAESAEVRVDVPDGLRVEAGALLEQMLVNLLANAAQAAGEAGRAAVIAVTVQGEGGRVRIRVTDNGAGIPDDVLVHLFEPFFTTKRGKGTGLGLAVSLGLARALGGDITVERTSEAGTTMRVELPQAAAPPAP